MSTKDEMTIDCSLTIVWQHLCRLHRLEALRVLRILGIQIILLSPVSEELPSDVR